MVNGDSGSQQLLETLRSIDTQTVVTMFLILAAAYVLGRVITALISKLSEKMSRKDRIDRKSVV